MQGVRIQGRRQSRQILMSPGATNHNEGPNLEETPIEAVF